MTRDEILSIVAQVIEEEFGWLASETREDDSLFSCLEFDDDDILWLHEQLAAEFGIEIPEDESGHWGNVGDVVKYLEGVLK